MSVETWIPILGSVSIEGGAVTHLGTPLPTIPGAAPPADGSQIAPPHSIVRSATEFEQGAISWEARLGREDCRVQVVLPSEASPGRASENSKGDSGTVEFVAGLNVLGTPYGFGVWSGVWEGAGGAGFGSALPLNEWIPLKLVVRGSSIELFVRGVRVLTTERTLRRGQIGFMLQGSAPCSFRNVVVESDEPMCFAVMQFTEEFNVLYLDVIKPVCECYGYRVIRGDDFFTSGQIMDDVLNSIRTASLVIADVTPDNANVYYEVGYAHAIGKPTILLSDRKRERLPFDISGFRTLFYDNTIGGKAVVEDRLRQHLDALRKN